MNRRQAKRIAAGLVAELAEQHAGRLVQGYGAPDDRERLRTGLGELVIELRARAGRTPPPAPDPNQVPLFDTPVVVVNACCDDTGYADYAAVPCPDPKCTAVPRVIEEARVRRAAVTPEGQPA